MPWEAAGAELSGQLLMGVFCKAFCQQLMHSPLWSHLHLAHRLCMVLRGLVLYEYKWAYSFKSLNVNFLILDIPP